MNYWKRMCFQNVKRYRAVCLLVFFVLLHRPVLAGAGEQDLTGLSIEELMGVKVTSVGKKEQNLSDSAAAIFVITNDDLKKSGVTNLPDALRMVPGINVARIDSNKWAVNSRSANSRFADKLLVMIDGRSVYTSTFSGVYWEVQDLLLEDVDRIEVIRGPGATLWGANAVNGVINIITKHAADTVGGLVSLGGGTLEQGFAGARYGDSLGENSYGRFYAKGFRRGEFEYAAGGDADDDWDMARCGFRVDSSLSAQDSFTVQGDIYKGNSDQQFDRPTSDWSAETASFFRLINDEIETSGGNMAAHWEHVHSSASKFSLQAYYDRTEREEDVLQDRQDSFDIELQNLLKVGERNEIVWGARYRYSQDDFTNVGVFKLFPESRQDNLYSLFFQDEIMITRDRLWLTLGSKLEHNDYTGFELQPSCRLFWDLQNRHKLWTSVSRAVRTPSRLDFDGHVASGMEPYPESFNPSSPFYSPQSPMPVSIFLTGNKDLKAEKLMAYELGYRFLFSQDFSLDSALFYHDYDQLRVFNPQNPVMTGDGFVVFMPAVNDGSAQSQGLELALAWQAADNLKLDLAYSFLDSNMERERQVGKEPKHQASLRGLVNLRDDLDLHLWFRYVSSVTTGYYVIRSIDAYATFDLRLAWRLTPEIEVSLVGQNLLDEGRVEFEQNFWTRATEISRSVYGKLAYTF